MCAGRTNIIKTGNDKTISFMHVCHEIRIKHLINWVSQSLIIVLIITFCLNVKALYTCYIGTNLRTTLKLNTQPL